MCSPETHKKGSTHVCKIKTPTTIRVNVPQRWMRVIERGRCVGGWAGGRGECVGRVVAGKGTRGTRHGSTGQSMGRWAGGSLGVGVGKGVVGREGETMSPTHMIGRKGIW